MIQITARVRVLVSPLLYYDYEPSVNKILNEI